MTEPLELSSGTAGHAMGGEIKYDTVGLVVGGGTGHGAKIPQDFLRNETGKVAFGGGEGKGAKLEGVKEALEDEKRKEPEKE